MDSDSVDLDIADSDFRVAVSQIPAKMVQDIALGLEDELVVASRHGFSYEDYQEIRGLKAFQLAVESQRAEYLKNGLTFKVKRAMQADDLFDDVFVAAKGNVPLLQKLQVAVAMARLGGLEPKEEKSAGSSGGFQISINLATPQQPTFRLQPSQVTVDNDTGEIDE